MKPKAPKTQYINLNKFNHHSKPLIDLTIRQSQPIQKQPFQILSFEISQSGKNGVFFIETLKGAFVLKCNNECPNDYFYNLIAEQLQLNVPEMNIISCYQQQFQDVVFSIEKFLQKDECLSARVKTRMDFPFYQLIEYVPSISMLHTGPEKFRKYMVEPHKLQSIGLCIGFDMIVNNPDRFHFLWPNQGNIHNALIEIIPSFGSAITSDQYASAKDRNNQQINLGKFVFIDHLGCMLDKKNKLASQNMEKYLLKVCALHLQCIAYLKKERVQLPNPFELLNKQILRFTQDKFTEDQLTHICDGIIYVTDLFHEKFRENIIQKIYESLKRDDEDIWSRKDELNICKNKNYVQYWNEYWNNQLKNIHISFLEEYFIKVSAIYETYPEVLKSVRQRVLALQSLRRRAKRKPSEFINNSSKPPSRQSQQKSKIQSNGQEDDIKQAEDKQEQSKKQRRWRQKLQAFKQNNYN